jgi:hypothetical protein
MISKPSISLSLDRSSRGIKKAKLCCFSRVLPSRALPCMAQEEERQRKDQNTLSICIWAASISSGEV